MNSIVRYPAMFAIFAGLLATPWAQNQEIGTNRIPAEAIGARTQVQQNAAKALEVAEPKQILFGDTHVHTTYSVDAFFWALPIMQGQGPGTFPTADACDYARYCSALDFYVLTDHAEAFTPEHWENAKESIRQCNAVAGDPENPDMVAYLGFEWTQVGATPEEHYGHKNVLFLDTEDDKVPARPIAALGIPTDVLRGSAGRGIARLGMADRENPQLYRDFGKFAAAMSATPDCEEGVNTRDLPKDCFEATKTPAGLYEKLDQWGFDTIVIPHGSTWGFYTPPTTTFDKHLAADGYDPDKQRLIELFSGHGNSEQYREFRAIEYDDEGLPYCPEPTKDFLPMCWQAGEIIRKRCLAVGFKDEECDKRAADARANFVSQPGIPGHLTVPGVELEEWLDAGQARDMFQPSFNYRPAESVQYSMAIGNFDDPENPLHHRWGFIASSDIHRARPGTGYKEFDRHRTTEGSGVRSQSWRRLLQGEPEYPLPESRSWEESVAGKAGFQLAEMERQASFFYTGGLAAVHSEGRNRGQIWDAMKRKEVYGTSGDRILLWFDLLNASEGTLPMGSETAMDEAPRFQVRAVGAFKQLPGAPDFVTSAISAERLQELCRSESYYPSDERKLITRIEVVRIRPQVNMGEDVGELIEDAWKVFECEPNPEGCTVEFSDPDFVQAKRNFVYYVRAIQEPSLAVSGRNLRPRYNSDGEVITVNPCYGDYRTEPSDDCLEEVEERAWSSPIFVDRSDG